MGKKKFAFNAMKDSGRETQMRPLKFKFAFSQSIILAISGDGKDEKMFFTKKKVFNSTTF